MTVNIFVRQLEATYWRIASLYNDANLSQSPKLEILPAALKELGVASEELQVAAEELSHQNERLAAVQASVEAEKQCYRDLFELAPNGYLVTDLNGVIQKANQAVGKLFGVKPDFLIGKPLVVYVAEAERQNFRARLSHLRHSRQAQDLEVHMQSREGEVFDSVLTVVALPGASTQLPSLCWLVRDVTKHRRALAVAENNEHDFSTDHAVHTFAKGEIIPLKPQAVCLVQEGLVKLSTLAESGKEVLMGLVGSSGVFGPTLTALPIYQATAVSDVQLIYIPLTHLTSSPHLAQMLLPKITQRLKQTEMLLLIAGQHRVKERLWGLLLLLQREVGQSVSGGTRLGIRLTHEDLASACCTTRVTITRLLSQLVQTGEIRMDIDHHIILQEKRIERMVR